MEFSTGEENFYNNHFSSVDFHHHHPPQILALLFYHSFFFLIIYFVFCCARSSLLCAAFLQFRGLGAILCCGAWASHCSGFSCSRAQFYGAQASVVASHGLSSSMTCWIFHNQGWMEPVSSKLAGGFLSTEQAGKSVSYRSWNKDVYHRVSVWLSSYTLFFFFITIL